MSLTIETALQSLDALKNYIAELQEKRSETEPVPIDKFGKYVRDYRKEHNYTLIDFAVTIGVSKNLLVSVEAGKLSASMANYIKVADAIGVELSFR